MNKKKKTILIVALLLVVFIGSISYALWSVTLEQTDSNIVKTGCFTVDMIEETDEINLPEEYPVLDSEGKTYTPFTFTITNTCTIDSSYSVNLDVDAATTLEHEYVKVALNNDAVRVLTDYKKASNEDKYQLTTGTLAGASSEGAGDGESVTYNLRLWLDQDTPESQMSKDFIAKVIIENITTSDKKELLATVDYSETDSEVVANYYSDGSIVFAGTGEMGYLENGGLIIQILNSLLATNSKLQDAMNKTATLSETSQGFLSVVVQLSFGGYKYSKELTGGIADLSYVTNNEELYSELESLVNTSGLIPEEEIEVVLELAKTTTEEIKQITSIEIQEGITSITSSLFERVVAPTLTMPSTMKEIENYAFENSSIEVVFNEGLEVIGEHSFRNSSISAITLPSTLETIKYYAFDNTKITSVVIPEKTNVWGHAFSNCSELTSVVWNSSDSSIGSQMFENNPKLTSAVIAENVTVISPSAFDDKTVNPNLVLKFRTSEENKSNITGTYNGTLLNLDNYNTVWGYTD